MQQLFATLFTCFLFTGLSHACIVVIAWDEEQVLVGNNEDWIKYDAKYWAEAPSKGEKYGAVFMGFKGNGKFPQGGVNSEGLFFDGTAIDKIDLDPAMREGRKAAKSRVFKHMMKRCATVEEALLYLDQFFIPFIRSAQVVIADKTGDYAVIHANGVVRRRVKAEKFVVVTNFHQGALENGTYVCERYDHAYAKLQQADRLSQDLIVQILKGTRRDLPVVKSVYSNVYNLTSGTIYNYYMMDFDTPMTLHVNDMIPEEDETDPVLFQDQAARLEQKF